MKYYTKSCKLASFPLYNINQGLRSLYQSQSLYLSSIDTRPDDFPMYLTKIPQSSDLPTYDAGFCCQPMFSDTC